MARKKVVVLEDNATRRKAMEDVLDDRFYMYSPQFFENSKPMIEWLARNHEEVVLISLDHDLVTSALLANAGATHVATVGRWPIIWHRCRRFVQ